MSEAGYIFTGGAFQGEDDSIATMGTITVSQFKVKFECEAFTMDLPTQGLEVDLDDAGDRILFAHPTYPGWRIYSLDPGIIEHRSLQRFGLKKRLADLDLARNGLPKHNRRVLGALAAIVGAFLILWLGADLILGAIVNVMPADWEQKVGNAAFKEISEELEMTDEAVLTNRVFLVSERLKKGLPYGAPKFRFHVADDHDLNAFALPNGQVIVLRGLIEDSSAEELAGVLAHEMAHVVEKHGMRAVAQMVGPGLIGKYLFGGDSALAALTEGAALLGGLQYSRENERQADDQAWEILMRANVDPRSLTRFFQQVRKMEGKGGEAADIFSTHPATAERIQALETRWSNSPKKSGFQPVDGGEQPPKSERKFRFPF